MEPDLSELTFEEVAKDFSTFDPLPMKEARTAEVKYEGRHLITNEIIERMQVKLPLLKDPVGAISFFREELEHATRLKSLHAQLAPPLQRFLEEVLFGKRVSMYDERVSSRLSDQDVREHIRAVFVPLIRKKTTTKQEREPERTPLKISAWRPFQATHSEHRPVEPADLTAFNLVSCNLQLEVAMTQFLDRADGVAAFAKNTGPQALRFDYLTEEHRRSTYTP